MFYYLKKNNIKTILQVKLIDCRNLFIFFSIGARVV